MPVWAIVVANFCRSWTFYLFTIHAASYFEEVYGIGVAKAATYVAVPHLIMALVVPFGGILADYTRQHHLSHDLSDYSNSNFILIIQHCSNRFRYHRGAKTFQLWRLWIRSVLFADHELRR